MTPDMYIKIIVLFGCLFVTGSILCLPLYNWNIRGFIHSKLWTKIVWWIPIFIIFLILVYAGTIAAVLVTLLLLAQSLREFLRNCGKNTFWAKIYFTGFIIATTHLAIFFPILGEPLAIKALVIVCFCSVLSDVCAFFCGTYFGKTPLPAWINQKKSWEGVAGQIIGAFIGYFIISVTLGITDIWIVILGIGVASAIGDLANSAAKRSLRIKDWGQAIPGHGGVLDRFSSLSAAILCIFWMTYITSNIL